MMSEASFVKVTAADCNMGLPPEKMFDGCPFSDTPSWLGRAVAAGRVVPHVRGGTDYAQWDVSTASGTVTAWPGDTITAADDGVLSVIPRQKPAQ
jgi:hypothetical protein